MNGFEEILRDLMPAILNQETGEAIQGFRELRERSRRMTSLMEEARGMETTSEECAEIVEEVENGNSSGGPGCILQ